MKSFLTQTVQNDNGCLPFEVVLVDDGSNDNTAHICKRYVDSYSWIKCIKQENKGLMRAWKNGVLAASGEYIVFCDSDDYVDADLIERIRVVIAEYPAQIFLFGMYLEYDNGDRIKALNLLKEGYYEKSEIENIIFPHLFFNGNMHSELISKSRCDKVFNRELLLKVMRDLPDCISFSEDDITIFATVINADSIYCMGDYCPYHYVRNSDSMIGAYDPRVFDKIELVYTEMLTLARKYNYQYVVQIYQEKLSVILLYMKKEICNNPNGRKTIINRLYEIRESESFKECISMCSVEGYSVLAKSFAKLIIWRLFSVAYIFVKIHEMLFGKRI